MVAFSAIFAFTVGTSLYIESPRWRTAPPSPIANRRAGAKKVWPFLGIQDPVDALLKDLGDMQYISVKYIMLCMHH